MGDLPYFKLKLIFSQIIADLRGTLSIEGDSCVFTDVMPCYLNVDAVVVKEIDDKIKPVIVKSEKRLKADTEYLQWRATPIIFLIKKILVKKKSIGN